MLDKKLKVAIIGASGYTGSELARFLIHHPNVEIRMITSETYKGQPFSTLHPQFLNQLDIPLVSADDVSTEDLDVVFLALPHGVSMRYVEKWKDKEFKIVDLSGDFRLSSPEVYAHWYQKEHTFSSGFAHAEYGLPELHKEAIAKCRLVANPGCYPTASILALAPLLAKNAVQTNSIIIDAKSGITGAGIKPSLTTHFSNVNENFKAYGLKNHRHTVEIEEQLGQLNKHAITVQFTPHLLPVDRGILVTAYATPNTEIAEVELKNMFRDFYAHAPFIRIKEDLPTIKDVRGSNFCDLYPVLDSRTNRVIVISAIDNLVKGAAGQAIHNMNLMFDLPETTGLLLNPIKP